MVRQISSCGWRTELSVCRYNRSAGPLRAYPALELSDLSILAGNFERASKWALEAAATYEKGQTELAELPSDVHAQVSETCPGQVHAFSNAGLAFFHLGDFKTATTCLNKSWQYWGRKQDLDGYGVEFQARNLELLAQIAIMNDDIEQARQLFERGVKLRAETKQSWNKTASAYELNSRASIALAHGDLLVAEKELSAAVEELLKDYVEVSTPLNVLVLGMLSNLKRLNSSKGDELFKRLFANYGTVLHKGERQTIAQSRSQFKRDAN